MRIGANRGRKPRGRINPMLMAALIVLTAYWLLAAFVLSVDPYDIYEWGGAPQLDPRDVTEDNKFLVGAVAGNPSFDLVMIGSSTAMPYSPADLRRAYPAAHHPYNLSYGGARPFDRALVMDTITRRSESARLVVWLDWTYALPVGAEGGGFPHYMYDSSRFNDLRMVNQATAAASLHLLRGQKIFGNFSGRMAATDATYAREYAAFQSAASAKRIAHLVTKYRSRIDRPGAQSCSALPSLTSGLLEPLKRWVAKGHVADVVIPAYSPTFYYVRGDPGTGLVLADQLMLRRCLVLGTAKLPGVRVFALDADIGLTGDLTNFKDPGHLYGARPLQVALDHIARGDFLVTPANLSPYLAGLHQRVLGLQMPGAATATTRNPKLHEPTEGASRSKADR